MVRIKGDAINPNDVINETDWQVEYKGQLYPQGRYLPATQIIGQIKEICSSQGLQTPPVKLDKSKGYFDNKNEYKGQLSGHGIGASNVFRAIDKVLSAWVPNNKGDFVFISNGNSGNSTVASIGKLSTPQATNSDIDPFSLSNCIILYGPPGTGKTTWAEKKAKEIILSALSAQQSNNVDEKEYVLEHRKLVQFHPWYSYNDFIETIDIKTKGFVPRIFKEFAKKAADAQNSPNQKNEKFALIIDEINRANVSEVLGELLYGLEYRGQSISTGLSGESFSVPDNLYIIGTMNTADRSLQSLDYAVRRRFTFIEVPSESMDSDPPGKKFIKKVFDTVKKDIEVSVARGVDAKDIMPGVSYFLVNKANGANGAYDEGHLEYKIAYELIPLLKEYSKDGMFTNRKKIYNEKTLIGLLKDSEYIDRIKERINNDN